jgi:DNA-binding MarR family transcriptional regulator/GNAT superfamily N-acetyltransferase
MTRLAGTPLSGRIEAVRRFNRFYTRKIGVLNEGLLRSQFSLTKASVLYELAHRSTPRASELSKDLGLDGGYLSRILGGFERRGLIVKKPCPTDGRQSLLALSAQGREAIAPLDASAREEVGRMLSGLSAAEQACLVESLRTVEKLLGAPSHSENASKAPYLLRSPRPGDMGWVVHRHGVLYAREYGWDERFEALVAGVVARFIERFDPRRERCWIAEKDGEIVGSVVLVKQSPRVAKLRLLLVEPAARGLGLGTRLVNECVRFARLAGYRKITLWTNRVLHAARHIYEKTGFRLVHTERRHGFGQHRISETWELTL